MKHKRILDDDDTHGTDVQRFRVPRDEEDDWREWRSERGRRGRKPVSKRQEAHRRDGTDRPDDDL